MDTISRENYLLMGLEVSAPDEVIDTGRNQIHIKLLYLWGLEDLMDSFLR